MSSVLASLAVAIVFQTTPSQVEIVAPRSEVEVQESVQLTARAIDGAGRVMDSVFVRWISSTPEIADVDQTGRVLATNPGTARITAVIGGRPTSTLIVIHEENAELRRLNNLFDLILALVLIQARLFIQSVSFINNKNINNVWSCIDVRA